MTKRLILRSAGLPPDGQTSGDSKLRVRPMAQAARIALFEKEVKERLSRAALAVVLGRAEVISEGQRMSRGGRAMFQGSTMLTIDLEPLATLLREPCDARTARKLSALMGQDAQMMTWVRAIAAAEVERQCGSRPLSVVAEMKVNARGAQVLVDVDVEAAL